MRTFLSLLFIAFTISNGFGQIVLPDNLTRNQKFHKIQEYQKIKRLQFNVKNNTVLNLKIKDITGLITEDRVNFIQENPRVQSNFNANTISGIRANSSKYDPRNLPGFPSVKNQSPCGSCWAFATADNFTISHYYKNNETIDISEQQVLSCSAAGDCSGGSSSPVYQWMTKNDTELTNEEEVPYQGSDFSCPVIDDFQDYKATDWGVIGSRWTDIPDVNSIKRIIAQYGAVSSYVYVSSLFQAYGSGVFNENSDKQVNHAVTIVGWDDGLNAWLIKNSWGNNWGDEGGYMWINYNSNKIGTNATWVEAKKSDVGPLKNRVADYKWSEGWTNTEFFQTGGKTYMLRAKAKGTGDSGKNVHIETINANGSIGRRVKSYKWSEGWTNIEFFQAGRKTYMLRAKAKGKGDSGKNVHIETINPNGSVGKRVKSYNWSEGWTNIEFFQAGGKTYMLRAKAKGKGNSGKNVHIETINPNGSVGKRVKSYNWSEGWTNIEFFQAGGKTYMLRAKVKGTGNSGKNVHIETINPNGSIGKRVKSYKWSEGWTNIEFFTKKNQSYLFLLKQKGLSGSGETVHIHKIDNDGKVGKKIANYKWEEGWTNTEFFRRGGNTYLFLLKQKGLSGSKKNVYINKVE